MPDLDAEAPLSDGLPFTAGDAALRTTQPDAITVVAPYGPDLERLNAVLSAEHGLTFPEANRATGREGMRLIWSGRAQALLVGKAPCTSAAAPHAALTDVTDGWAVLHLTGEGAADVLARLTSLDLRAGHFKRGHSARSELGHVPASITRVSDGFMILVMRSFAKSTAKYLMRAMQGVAAREAVDR